MFKRCIFLFTILSSLTVSNAMAAEVHFEGSPCQLSSAQIDTSSFDVNVTCKSIGTIGAIKHSNLQEAIAMSKLLTSNDLNLQILMFEKTDGTLRAVINFEAN